MRGKDNIYASSANKRRKGDETDIWPAKRPADFLLLRSAASYLRAKRTACKSHIAICCRAYLLRDHSIPLETYVNQHIFHLTTPNNNNNNKIYSAQTDGASPVQGEIMRMGTRNGSVPQAKDAGTLRKVFHGNSFILLAVPKPKVYLID